MFSDFPKISDYFPKVSDHFPKILSAVRDKNDIIKDITHSVDKNHFLTGGISLGIPLNFI